MTAARLALEVVLGLGVAASWAYHLLCWAGARAWSRAPRPNPPAPLPSVSILKPVRGTDPEQQESFAGFARQDYPGYELIFGALDPDDPGLLTARRLQEEFPDAEIRIAAGGEAFGLNRKVCNLQHMLAGARGDILVLCDSDMRVAPEYLRRVVAPFADPAVGLVTCLYRGYRPQGLASSLEALGIGADFVPSVFAATRTVGLQFAFGSTIAVRRQALADAGGFAALADELADDYRLAERVGAAGWRIALSDYVVDDVLGREPFGAMWARRLRWNMTCRAMRPAGWAGAAITHSLVWSLLFLAAGSFAAYGWATLAATLLVRGAAVTWIARRATGDTNLPRLLPLLPLSDLVTFALWAGSFLGRHVTWRGERFRLGPGGKLMRVS